MCALFLYIYVYFYRCHCRSHALFERKHKTLLLTPFSH